jgi:hypothetical protein
MIPGAQLKKRMPNNNNSQDNGTNGNSEVVLPPDAAIANDNQNPRRRQQARGTCRRAVSSNERFSDQAPRVFETRQLSQMRCLKTASRFSLYRKRMEVRVYET